MCRSKCKNENANSRGFRLPSRLETLQSRAAKRPASQCSSQLSAHVCRSVECHARVAHQGRALGKSRRPDTKVYSGRPTATAKIHGNLVGSRPMDITQHRSYDILRALPCNNDHLDSQQSRSPVQKEHVRSDTASCTSQVSFGSPYFLDVFCLVTIMAETIVDRWIRTMVKPIQGATKNAQIMAMSQSLSGKVQSSIPHNTNSELKNRSSLSVNPPMHN